MVVIDWLLWMCETRRSVSRSVTVWVEYTPHSTIDLQLCSQTNAQLDKTAFDFWFLQITRKMKKWNEI